MIVIKIPDNFKKLNIKNSIKKRFFITFKVKIYIKKHKVIKDFRN